MNILVKREDSVYSHLTGGETAVLNVEISVDTTLPSETQRELVIHAVVECYCRSWPHDKIEELTELIQKALEQLEGLQEE